MYQYVFEPMNKYVSIFTNICVYYKYRWVYIYISIYGSSGMNMCIYIYAYIYRDWQKDGF